MRLLHTTTLQLTDFVGKAPPYAILSHTWAEEEVLFADVSNPDVPKAGWAKVRNSCALARSLGHTWIWIDTCCIDKSSSAELSEAINSMFRFYQKATICIAYLSDVTYPASKADTIDVLRKSRWFTRGWTLQELLAPKHLDFYSSDWKLLGSRARFRSLIAKTTGIGLEYIGGNGGQKSLDAASVAERMSWASKRRTTRLEDIAYCLLGIFGINMPLIYGEGERAFQRLQKAIIYEKDDQSIFAWGSRYIPIFNFGKWSSPLLAGNPSWFEDAWDIVPFSTGDASTPLLHAGNGVTITTPLLQDALPLTSDPSLKNFLLHMQTDELLRHRQESLRQHKQPRMDIFLAPLKCRRKQDPYNCVVIPLCKAQLQKSALEESPTCHRVSHAVRTAPRSVWVSENICKPFVYFQSNYERRGMQAEKGQGCMIRTIPLKYRIVHGYFLSTEHQDLPPDIIAPAISSRILARRPTILRLRGKLQHDLALALRFVFSPDDLNRSPVAIGMTAEIMYIPSDLRLEVVAHILDRHQRSSVVSDKRGIRECETLKVTVTQSAAYGPSTWLVDIVDTQGVNISKETDALTGFFEPVRPQVSRGSSAASGSIERQSLSSSSMSSGIDSVATQAEIGSHGVSQCHTPTYGGTQRS
ncbi:het domain-containing protein [Colletotrichum kahawae]|uniref:Het domain-containing protein n=1 Tax=Colletotrichum kahawae TaxID=34407 RepID=A0AAE0D9L1_COLKA|nr:het domain-containing protein [Colletotrichum kahawae]